MKNVLTTTFQNFQMWVSENFSFKFFAGTQRNQKMFTVRTKETQITLSKCM